MAVAPFTLMSQSSQRPAGQLAQVAFLIRLGFLAGADHAAGVLDLRPSAGFVADLSRHAIIISGAVMQIQVNPKLLWVLYCRS